MFSTPTKVKIVNNITARARKQFPRRKLAWDRLPVEWWSPKVSEAVLVTRNRQGAVEQCTQLDTTKKVINVSEGMKFIT